MSSGGIISPDRLKSQRSKFCQYNLDDGYERTFPVYDGVPTDGAPIHILTGTGGRPLTQFTKQSVWSNERVSAFGFTQVHVNGNTSMLIEFIDIDGMVRDSVELFR